MWFTKVSLRNPVFATMVMLALLVLGLFSFQRLKVDQFPNIDFPVVVVTMRGAQSGKVRKIALMRVEHGGEYAFVASYGGAPKHPVWYHNLVAHPDEVLLQDGPEPFRVRVREVHGDERAEWWQRAVAVFSNYGEYQQRTERTIPVLVASPA